MQAQGRQQAAWGARAGLQQGGWAAQGMQALGLEDCSVVVTRLYLCQTP